MDDAGPLQLQHVFYPTPTIPGQRVDLVAAGRWEPGSASFHGDAEVDLAVFRWDEALAITARTRRP